MSGMGGFAQQAQQLQSQMPANLQTQGQAGAPEYQASQGGVNVGQIPGSTSGYRPPGGQMFGPGGGYYAPGTFDAGQGAGGARPPGVPDWAPQGWQPHMGEPLRGSGTMSNLMADVMNRSRLAQEQQRGGGTGMAPPPSFAPPGGGGNFQDPVRQFGRFGQVGAPEYGYGRPHTRGAYNQQAFGLGHQGFTPDQWGRSGYGPQPSFMHRAMPVTNPFAAGIGGGGPRFGQNFGANFGGRGFNPFGGPSGQNFFGGGFRPFGGAMGYGGPQRLMGPGYAGSGMGMPQTSTFHSGAQPHRMQPGQFPTQDLLSMLRTGGQTPAFQGMAFPGLMLP